MKSDWRTGQDSQRAGPPREQRVGAFGKAHDSERRGCPVAAWEVSPEPAHPPASVGPGQKDGWRPQILGLNI